MPEGLYQKKAILNCMETFAVVDMGSNSFRLVVVRCDENGIETRRQSSWKVQLAAGMVDGKLSAAAIERALSCLQNISRQLNGLPAEAVRVVGTYSLREASNAEQFVQAAEKILTYPVEIISGEEEARLVYLGVVNKYIPPESSKDDCSPVNQQVTARPPQVYPAEPRRLVIDIGGGSTELIVGCEGSCLSVCSLPMGCVVFLDRFFADGKLNESNLQQACQHCRQLLPGVKTDFIKYGWDEVIGSSGTVQAVEQVLVAQGWSESGITRSGLLALRQAVLGFECLDDLHFQGLSEKRRSVFVSGLAIVLALFDEFDIDSMQVSNRALREGVLYELMHAQGGCVN